MADKEVLYDGVSREDWVGELGEYRPWIRKHLFALWSIFGVPASMLDVGCGLGELVIQSRAMQVDAYGVDQLCDENYHPGWFAHHNLWAPFSLTQIPEAPSVTEMVICWEVGEHIPDRYIGVFCDTICNHLMREGRLYFSAAHPGQGGTEHVSTRPATFWHERFYERGLNYNQRDTDKVKVAWLNMESPMFWLSANIGVFTK